jgi:hypothetical protein
MDPTKIATFNTSTQHGKSPESVTTVNFAIHVCCSYSKVLHYYDSIACD